MIAMLSDNRDDPRSRTGKCIVTSSFEKMLSKMGHLLVALWASFSVCSCSAFSLDSKGAFPFVSYEISRCGDSLDTLHVKGHLRGISSRRFSLRAATDENGREMVPLNFSASSEGSPVKIEEKKRGRFVVCKGMDVDFEYDVALDERGKFSADIRSMLTLAVEDRVRMAGRDLFLIPDLDLAEGVIVDVSLFEGAEAASAWPSVGRRLIVPSVEDLSSALMVSGAYRVYSEEVGGVSLKLAIGEEWSFDDSEFLDILSRIVSAEIRSMGSAPLEHYIVICDRNPVTSISRFDHYGVHYGNAMLVLLNPHTKGSDLVDAPAVVIAHEFFHNWNGCNPGDAGGKFAWFTEGATVYCSYEILKQCGFVDRARLERRRAAISERFSVNRYRSRLSIADAGNGDLADKDMVNMLYDGGYLACEVLDSRLRSETGGRVCLLDVVRELSLRTVGGEMAAEEVLLAAIEELGAGDFSSFLRELVHVPSPSLLASNPSILE